MKNIIKSMIKKVGYDLVRQKKHELGEDLSLDLSRLIKNDSPVIFDVGANKGQTVDWLIDLFPTATIYAFEPTPRLFEVMQEKKYGKNVHLKQFALGENNSIADFTDYGDEGVLNSFLEINNKDNYRFSDVSGVAKYSVDIVTLDRFVQENNIESIDFLKIDTQGYDLFVLKGAHESLKSRKIKNIYVEMNFISLYEGQSDCFELWSFLMSHGYNLVDFYEKARDYNSPGVNEIVICWANGLFSTRQLLG